MHPPCRRWAARAWRQSGGLHLTARPLRHLRRSSAFGHRQRGGTRPPLLVACRASDEPANPQALRRRRNEKRRIPPGPDGTLEIRRSRRSVMRGRAIPERTQGDAEGAGNPKTRTGRQTARFARTDGWRRKHRRGRRRELPDLLEEDDILAGHFVSRIEHQHLFEARLRFIEHSEHRIGECEIVPGS